MNRYIFLVGIVVGIVHMSLGLIPNNNEDMIIGNLWIMFSILYLYFSRIEDILKRKQNV